MRRIIVSEFASLDGVIEDPGGAEKSRYGGWSLQFFSPEVGKYKFDELFACDAMLLGRLTYQGFAAAWPSRKDEYGFADRMNGMPKYVVSRTLKTLDWSNSRLIEGDAADGVRRLQQEQGGDILVAGSASLVRTLIAHDLIDEYRVMIHPIVLGGGKRLFPDGLDRKLFKLIEAKTFTSGVVALAYAPARPQ